MQSWQFTNETQTRPRGGGESGESPLATTCLQIVDLGLMGIIFIAPLFFGGRHTLGRGIFIGLVAVTAIAWFVRQATLRQAIWNRTWATLLAAAAILVVATQLVPMPSGWLEQLSPRNSSLLTLWNGDAGLSLGAWQTISLTPGATSMALATLVAYVLLFVTAVGRLRTEADIQRLLRLVAFAAILMSGFGLLQYFTTNGRFFWFYEYPFTTTHNVAKGSFTCRNHFAHFLVLGFGPLLAWTAQILHSKKTPGDHSPAGGALMATMYLSLILVVIGVLLSLSRGGTIALMVVSTVAVAIYYRRGLVSGTHLYGLATLALMVMGLLSLYGSEQVERRLNTLTSGSVEKLDQGEGRRKVWNANLAAIKQGGLFGSGAGSHREIYPIYLPESLNVEYTHAENGYLQVATEDGVLGAVLLAAAILMVGSWCWRAVRRSQSNSSLILAGAVTASLMASLAHSFVDFVWFIPACMSITILLAASALRLAQLSASNEAQASISVSWSRLRWGAAAAVVSFAAIWTVSVVVRPAWASTQWDRYLISSRSMKAHISQNLMKGEQAPDNEAQQLLITENSIFHLRQVLERNPESARANLRLAGKYLQLFDLKQRASDNAMSIDQIRDAAMSSQFASANELRAWLNRAFGENSKLLYRAYRHTRLALELCPLQGEGYLYLANLCFLEGRTQESIDAYLSQSLQVRPHNGQVQFEVGRQKLLLGQSEEAIAHWQKIFNDAGMHQMQIVQLLAGRIPADLFCDTFHPGWKTLPAIWQQYRKMGSEEDWLNVLQRGLVAAKSESEKLKPDAAANNWRRLALMQRELGQIDQALISLRLACEISPSFYWARRELGRTLLQAEQYGSALSHLRWCYARQPNKSSLKIELLEARKHCEPKTAHTASTFGHK
ncbi:MAG: hypothetical protein GXP26_14910 [Planctomycetes bacterium]|nr:hypothetical protein [Planctomycetota bacterium]